MSSNYLLRHKEGKHLIEIDEASIRALRVLSKYNKKSMKSLIRDMALERVLDVPAGDKIQELIINYENRMKKMKEKK